MFKCSRKQNCNESATSVLSVLYQTPHLRHPRQRYNRMPLLSTRRIAISDHRLLAADNGQVRFHWRSYRQLNRRKTTAASSSPAPRYAHARPAAPVACCSRDASSPAALRQHWRRRRDSPEPSSNCALTLPSHPMTPRVLPEPSRPSNAHQRRGQGTLLPYRSPSVTPLTRTFPSYSTTRASELRGVLGQ